MGGAAPVGLWGDTTAVPWRRVPTHGHGQHSSTSTWRSSPFPLLSGLLAAALATAVIAVTAAAPAGAASPSPVPAHSALTSGNSTSVPPLSPISSASPAPGSGAQIFAANCSGCHGARGEGLFGPSLAAAASPDLVAGKIRAGGFGMPSLARLGEATINAAAGYVAGTLSDPSARGADAVDGGGLYRLYCSGCHGATARGGALANGKNAPSLAKYPAAEVLAAVILGRSNMPVFAGNTLNVRQQTAVALYVRDLISPVRPGGSGLGFVGPVAEGALAGLGLLVLVLLAVWLAWGKGGKARV